MADDRHFLIIDPHFFIYPEHEDLPLNVKTVSKFVLNLVEWAKIFKDSRHDIGITQECIDIIKHHPRSILNGKFILNLVDYMALYRQQIVQVIQPMLSTIKNQLMFAEALSAIDAEQLMYEVESVTIMPEQFSTRLPQGSESSFQRMLGDLTFARAQKIFPIASFENVSFVTQALETDEWIEELLTTIIQVTYVIDVPDSDADLSDSIPNMIDDSYDVVQVASEFARKKPKKQLRQNLKQVVDEALKKYPSKILVSHELKNVLKNSKDILTNASTLQRAIEALSFWVKTYHEKRSEYGEAQSITLANEAYQKLVSHEISDASETVKKDETLRNQRLVRFEGEEHFAFLHIKTTPRIHFTVIRHNDNYAVLLGPIVQHLSTAKY